MLRNQPEFPPEFSHLLTVLARFAAPIDWASFEAHSRMTRRTYSRWELDVLAHADRKRQQ